MYTEKDHTFVISAYKENPYLQKTIDSVKGQTISSNIILATSTPNDYLQEICRKNDIVMHVNPERKGAGCDWNYGYEKADTSLVTVVHQDDHYEPDYLENILKAANDSKKPIIIFSDYYELRNDERVESNKILKIKRLMLKPLSKRSMYKSRAWRNLILSVGDPICCPAVTYCKENCGERPFDMTYKNSCDYKTFVDLAHKDGEFIYIPKMLVAHRIYLESATTLNISENIRQKEDLEIIASYWPRPIARLINRLYASSEKSNTL